MALQKGRKMYEKVNPSHPDKMADRIAGALVDYAYKMQENPKIAVEVLIGHGKCHIIAETSIHISDNIVNITVARICGEKIDVDYVEVPQDAQLAKNQVGELRCGDNGIFRGSPTTEEQKHLSKIARKLYSKYRCDGKYIIDDDEVELIVCQSNADADDIASYMQECYEQTINPLGNWTGGINVDSGATNRKLGSDMGDAVTGGGLHGKDLSKADVSVNIYAHLKAQAIGEPVEIFCAIGDEVVDGKPYSEIVKIAKGYIDRLGGFERLAEWGLI